MISSARIVIDADLALATSFKRSNMPSCDQISSGNTYLQGTMIWEIDHVLMFYPTEPTSHRDKYVHFFLSSGSSNAHAASMLITASARSA